MSSAKRILFCEVCEDGSVGGSHQIMYDCCTLLDRARFEPIVVFYQANRFSEMMRDEGFVVHTWDEVRAEEKARMATGNKLTKLPSYAKAIATRRRILAEERIDLVHLNNSPFFGLDDWLPAAMMRGIPCVANVMGRPYDYPGPGPRRMLVQRFDRIMSISKHVSEELLAAGFPESQLVHNVVGIDVARFLARVDRAPEDVREEFGIAPDKTLVVMVGNLQHWKGHDVVISAIERMPAKDREGFFFLFAGAVRPEDEAYLAQLEGRAAAGGFSDSIHFAGARTDVPSLGAAADIMLHASTVAEPFGIVLVEALSLGKPLVAAAIGGPLEVLTPECGRLFDPARPQELTDELLALGADPGLRARLGAAARERANHFTTQHTVDGMVAFYEELLGG